MKTAILCVLFASASLASHASAQMLANFQASDYTTGSPAWTDTQGVNATTTGAPVGNGQSITLNGGYFLVNSGSIGLTGKTSFTMAIGFTATAIPNGGGQFYSGNGLLGMDIGAPGQGDAAIALSNNGDGTYSLVFGGGSNADPGNPQDINLNVSYSLNVRSSLVLVVDAAAGTFSGYVGGVRVAFASGISRVPFGTDIFTGQTNDYDIGIGRVVNGGDPADGEITQVQFYGNALSNSEAAALSLVVANNSVPEPSACALLAGGLGGLLLIRAQARRHSWESFLERRERSWRGERSSLARPAAKAG